MTEERVEFRVSPDRYRHWRVSYDGPVATLVMDVDEQGGLVPGYELKLNSYDSRRGPRAGRRGAAAALRAPRGRLVVITSGQAGRVFCRAPTSSCCSTSTHAWKVNFCRFTNETRLYDRGRLARNSGQKYLAALNGIASGGGVRAAAGLRRNLFNRRSQVGRWRCPRCRYLGVLPGTGGLTRVSDKRKVRRDLADVFCTLAEGVKGKRAVEWGLVDDVFPQLEVPQEVEARAADRGRRSAVQSGRASRSTPLQPEMSASHRSSTVTCPARLARAASATLRISASDSPPAVQPESAEYYALRMLRRAR